MRIGKGGSSAHSFHTQKVGAGHGTGTTVQALVLLTQGHSSADSPASEVTTTPLLLQIPPGALLPSLSLAARGLAW